MNKYYFLFIILTLSSCDIMSDMGPKAKASFVIKDLKTVQTDSVTISEYPHTVRILMKGEVSDSVKVVWSYSSDSTAMAVATNSIYSSKVLHKGKVDYVFRGDFYSKTLYFRYIPFNNTTTGDLKAQITLF
jgi:hypothetical protein